MGSHPALLERAISRATETSRNDTSTLSTESGNFHVLPLEVTDRNQVFSSVTDAQRLHGQIDVVVNNACYGSIGGSPPIS